MKASWLKNAAVAIGSAALAFALGAYTGAEKPDEAVRRSMRAQANSVELVRDVRTIMRLVAVHGDFEEYFSEQDSKVASEIMRKLGFGKRAMLRVKGKVTIGYTFEDKDIQVDEAARTLILKTTNQPSLLSVEHDVDYVDLDQGLFNRFRKEDITAINARGKERIKQKALKSDLLRQARDQRDEAIEVVRGLAAANDWSFSLDTTATPGIAQR